MGIALFLLAADAPAVKREMRIGLERRYRVRVEQEGGDEYAYRLRAKVVDPAAKVKLPKSLPPGLKPDLPAERLVLELRLADYRATVEGQKVSAPLIGGGQMPVGPNGLPLGLSIAGPQGPVWLPLLALYLPADGAEGPFTVARVAVGNGLDLLGEGALAREKGVASVSLDARLATKEKEIAKLTLSTRLDAQGWPTKAEGTFVGDDGTYRFTLTRG